MGTIEIDASCRDFFALVDLVSCVNCKLPHGRVVAVVNVGCAGVIHATVRCKDSAAVLAFSSHRNRISLENGNRGQYLSNNSRAFCHIDVVLSKFSKYRWVWFGNPFVVEVEESVALLRCHVSQCSHEMTQVHLYAATVRWYHCQRCFFDDASSMILPVVFEA